MADTAVETLRELGYEVAFSDLYRMGFDPVSDRRNFARVKNRGYFKQQVEEDHATETRGLRSGRRGGDREARSGRSHDLAVSAVVVQRAGHPQRLGGQGVRLQPDLRPWPLLRQGPVSREAGVAVSHDRRQRRGSVPAGRFQRRHQRRPASDPARHAGVPRLRRAEAADRARPGAGDGGGAQGAPGRLARAPDADRAGRADRGGAST